MTDARGQGPTVSEGTDTPNRRRERLDKALARTSDAPLRIGNRLALLQNGPDTYDDWLAAIGRAGRWVHLDNYIFQDDAVGRRFADALKEKAAEGVPVRVLHDWFGSMNVSRSFWRELRGAGVEVRPVNPPTLGAPFKAIRRDHRKLLAVDGEYASTGGVCIDEGWLARSPETGLPYRDTAVSVRGPAVSEVERAFAGVWDESGGPLPDGERPDQSGTLSKAMTKNSPAPTSAPITGSETSVPTRKSSAATRIAGIMAATMAGPTSPAFRPPTKPATSGPTGGIQNSRTENPTIQELDAYQQWYAR